MSALPDPYEEVPPPTDDDAPEEWEHIEGTTTTTTTTRFEAALRRERNGEQVLVPELVDPERFFGKTGLLHATLRTEVRDIGPIATGIGRTLWHFRDGVWLPQGDDEVRRRCRDLLGQRWRRSHVDGIVTDLAADEPFITDAQPTEWINTRTGLLDWRTGALVPHTPDVATTYQLAAEWNPNATCPTVDDWLTQVAPPDAIGLIWEVIGTAIYGDQPFHRAVMLVGPGRNGKGTLLRLVARLIGPRHVSAVTLQALGESRFAAAELFGKVANIAGDLDARSIGKTDVFKMATGGDTIQAERKYGDPFQFTNRATMLFSANELPGSADLTDGFFSRWVVVPFHELMLAPGDEDATIEPRMHAEVDGVLVKAVDGLRRAINRGSYDTPASVLEATAGYQESADPLRRFLDDEIQITGADSDTLTRRSVYERYKKWCDDNGARPLGANRFWPRMTATCGDRIDVNAGASHGDRYVSGLNFNGETSRF